MVITDSFFALIPALFVTGLIFPASAQTLCVFCSIFHIRRFSLSRSVARAFVHSQIFVVTRLTLPATIPRANNPNPKPCPIPLLPRRRLHPTLTRRSRAVTSIRPSSTITKPPKACSPPRRITRTIWPPVKSPPITSRASPPRLRKRAPKPATRDNPRTTPEPPR